MGYRISFRGNGIARDGQRVDEVAVAVIAYYLHNFDPVLIPFGERGGVHWYGVAYVAAFLVGFLILRTLARKGLTEVPEKKLGDFITYSAIFGVLVGGRLGYMLLYDLESLLANPMNIVMLHRGGMASHGGFIGVAVFALIWSRRNNLSWTGVGDDFVTAAPAGIFCVRLANYVNGELFGRVATVPWAVRFPTEVFDSRYRVPDGFDGVVPWSLLRGSSSEMVERAASSPELAAFLEYGLNPRHPSQIYEALLEGLVLFVVLLVVRLRFPGLPHGILTGLFFLLYAVFRIFCEFYRLPDDGESLILGMSKGQFYSGFMIVAGLAFIGWGALRGRGESARTSVEG